jgi:sulfur carrier protein
MPTIRLNGETRDVADGTTVAGLIEDLGLGGRPVAIEQNREIVQSDSFKATVIFEGDVIEVVSFVPGG